MYVLGVLTGMLGAWAWLAFASPHALAENAGRGVVEVLCTHCGRKSWVSHSDVRVDTKCMKCR